MLDADAISRSVTMPGGAAIPDIRATFGSEFVNSDGAMDRDRMRELVFAKPEAKGQLERIIHPLVAREMDIQVRASTAPCLIFDVPLLVESRNWRSRVDKVLVVDCSIATQVDRVMARSGWTEDAVLAVIANQASRSQRLGAADLVIFNDRNGLEPLRRTVGEMAAKFGL